MAAANSARRIHELIVSSNTITDSSSSLWTRLNVTSSDRYARSQLGFVSMIRQRFTPSVAINELREESKPAVSLVTPHVNS